MQSDTLAAYENVSIISCTSWESVRSSWERASARTVHHSGTTLRAVPPEMTPTFALVTSSILPRRRSAIARDAAWIAERPSSGAIPAWAARPWNRTSNDRADGAPITTSPIGAAWS